MPNSISDYQTLLSDSNVKAFLELIRYGEGTDGSDGYYILVRGTERNGQKAPLYFTDISDHPQYSSEHFPGVIVDSERVSTAAGAYQFIGSTWKDKQNKLGLPDFSPNSQDLAALLNIGTSNLKLIQEGNVSLAIDNLNGQWTSLPGGSQQRMTLARALAVYKSKGGVLNPNDSLIASTSNYKTTDVSGAESTNGNEPVGNIEVNFKEIELNYASVEADNAYHTPWGGQLTLGEESGYIGLKQYLLYLTSKLYPQYLIPFVELIPVYTIENSSKKVFGNASNLPDAPYYITNPNPISDDSINKWTQSDGSLYTPLIKKSANENFINSKTLVDTDRFDVTAKKLLDASRDGGLDIFTTDPFKESTDAFNISNEDDKKLREERGFGFKIFGNLSVNPSLQFNETSKAGEVGLKSLEIELGSQTHFGLTLVTVKLLDVQGNKFLDVNSPWSFILNSRPGMAGGDFYFRYGWQINIPDENREDDDQAKRFWNHKGWENFQGVNVASGKKDVDGGKAIKKTIKDIAALGNGTLTLTQSNTQTSFYTSGYNQDENGRFFYQRNLDWTLYDTLTLINPELDVDPETGAMTATLYFRANTGVANCLALLNGTGNNGNLLTKELCKTSQTNTTTLSKLMAAFVIDNFNYINNNPAFKGMKSEIGNRSIFLSKGITKPEQINVKDWLTVVGGAGTDSLTGIDPNTIPIKFDNDDLQSFETKTDDTRLLIAWLNEVLSKNNLTIITAGSDTSASESAAKVVSNVPMGGFLIAYDDSNSELADKIKTSGVQNLSITNKTFADYRKYINNQSGTEDFIGNRLTVQDDVFSFKFQGSLVESINIEKLQQPTQSTILAQQNFAGEVDPNDTDVQKGVSDASQFDNGDTIPTGQNSSITYQTKKVMLNILYSSMLGLKVEAMCHPWIRLCRPVFLKGMGFWDGQYMATKIVHHLSEDNKFTSTINACRVWNKAKMDENGSKQIISQQTGMNYPGVNMTSSRGLVANTSNNTNSTTPINAGYSNGSIYSFSGIPLIENNIIPLRPSLENFIKNLHYTVQNDFREFIRAFELAHPEYLVLITSGYRSFQEQFALYNSNADNAKPGYSMHNFGMACDINLFNSKTSNLELSKSSSNGQWIDTGIVTMAKSRSFTWGGDSFGSYNDTVHFGFDGKFDIEVLITLAKEQFGSLENTIGNQLVLPNTVKPVFNGMAGGDGGGSGANDSFLIQ